MPQDTERNRRVREAMAQADLDALVCRLPENLVLLAGYWPVIGRSAVVFPREGEPAVLAPVLDRDALDRATVEDIRTFPVWKLGDPGVDASLEAGIREVLRERGLLAGRLGYDGSFEDISPTQKVLEPWTPIGTALLGRAAAGAELVDATDLLLNLRSRKTPFELERIRVANEIAAFGIEALRRGTVPGKTEAALAAEVEAAVMSAGSGYKGTLHARAQAFILAGPERLYHYGWGVAPNTTRRLQPGDMVMLELCTVADGYFSDLTRMRTAGHASAAQRNAYAACAAAQSAALAAVRAGGSSQAVDTAARAVLKEHGLADAFIHITGHGLGFRYHDGVPFLLPGVDMELLEGMVHSIEPGIYTPELGGIRIEDNVAVTAAGYDLLSGAGHELED